MLDPSNFCLQLENFNCGCKIRGLCREPTKFRTTELNRLVYSTHVLNLEFNTRLNDTLVDNTKIIVCLADKALQLVWASEYKRILKGFPE